jgi:hypothetical protein
MTKKEFQKYLDRDGGCVHCGDTETAVPNHRANRGMGGSRERDVPSNVIVGGRSSVERLEVVGYG